MIDLTKDDDDGESAEPCGEPLRKVRKTIDSSLHVDDGESAGPSGEPLRKTVGSSSPDSPPAIPLVAPPPSPITPPARPPVTPPTTPPVILPITPPVTPPVISPATPPDNQSGRPSTSGASSHQRSPDTTGFYGKTNYIIISLKIQKLKQTIKNFVIFLHNRFDRKA